MHRLNFSRNTAVMQVLVSFFWNFFTEFCSWIKSSGLKISKKYPRTFSKKKKRKLPREICGSPNSVHRTFSLSTAAQFCVVAC